MGELIAYGSRSLQHFMGHNGNWVGGKIYLIFPPTQL